MQFYGEENAAAYEASKKNGKNIEADGVGLSLEALLEKYRHGGHGTELHLPLLTIVVDNSFLLQAQN